MHPSIRRFALVTVGLLALGGTCWLDLCRDKKPVRLGARLERPSEFRSALPAPPGELHLDAFYRKYVDADGIPVVSSERVSDRALLAAQDIVIHMLRKRRDARAHLVAAHVRITVMSPDEQTLDVPEYADLRDTPTDTPNMGWNERTRGLGGQVTSCGEENLLCSSPDRLHGENILMHEFAHAIEAIGLEDDPVFHDNLGAAYAAALGTGLWRGTYAATNAREYWAEGVQDWFDANFHDGPEHNDIHTRGQLATYDPALHGLLARVFDDDGWRYRCPVGADGASGAASGNSR